jgi:hypothetical protein
MSCLTAILKSLRPVLLLPPALVLLAGCGVSGNVVTPISGSSAISFAGRAMGGQQPVSGAVIQLYASGLGGNGSVAAPLLTRTVVTDADGHFTIAGDFSCPGDSAPLYITASGGNPGLPGNVSNSAITLVAAIGSCSNLTASTYININEVTTAAAAWALAPFAQSTTYVGSSNSNLTGLNNAFLTAGNLAEISTGLSPGLHLPSNATVNSGKVYALANILATCVNSDGGSPCTTLFSDSKLSYTATPVDTFQAALAIVTHPGNNVDALFSLIPSTPPFTRGLSAAPPDWTLAIKYTGGGLHAPSSLGVDGTGNIWVANYFSSVSVFSPTGTSLFPSGITGGGLNHSYGIALDSGDNAWVVNQDTSVNQNKGSVSVFNSFGQSVAGTNGFIAGGLNFPTAIAVDSNATTWVVNDGDSTVTLLSSSGMPLSGASGYGNSHLVFPVAIALDAAHNGWVANQSGNSVSRISPDGTQITDFACCNGPSGIAIDQNVYAWVTNYYGDNVSRISNAGTVTSYSAASINHPQGIAVDSAGAVWVANLFGAPLTQLAGSNFATPGSSLSPTAGWGSDTDIVEPYSIAIDASGNLWVTGFGDDSLTQFVGLAAPVKTPRLGPPQVP